MKEVLLNIIPSILISLVLQLLIHEVGHFIGGLITSWNLLYLQLFNTAVVREKGLFRLRFVSTFSFQCIMYPDKIDNGALLYTAMGCLMNFFGTVIGLILMITRHNDPVIWLYDWSFFIIGFILCVFNAIPNTKRVCNDGSCFDLLRTNKITKQYHNAQLIAARYLFNGMTYKQIGEEFLCLSALRADNDILAYQAVLEYYYFLDVDNIEMMQKALAKIDIDSAISQCVKDIIYMELLYIELYQKLRNEDMNPIGEQRYDGNIHEYIKLHEVKGDVHSLRVRAIFEIYKKFHDGENISILIYNYMERINYLNCIYMGERIFCIEQLKKFI